MTLEEINTKITNLTGQSTTTYPNSSRVIDLNIWYRAAQTAIIRAQDDCDFDDLNNTTNFPIYTTNIIANQKDYALPPDTLKIKRLEVSYDGVNFHKADTYDIGERTRSTASNDLGDFSTSRPRFDVQGGSFILYPIPSANVTNGLKIWISRPVTDFTEAELNAGTATPGFDSLFHDILAYGSAFEFCIAKSLFDKAKSYKVILDGKIAELENYYGKKNEDNMLSFNPFNRLGSYK